MDAPHPDRPCWAFHAVIGLLAPLVLAIALFAIGPDRITVHRHADWTPIFFAPAALAFLAATAAAVRGGLTWARGGHGHWSL
ncbi:hypothetical protein [Actinomadura chokoriensis]|uniref:DUF1648 domain-containing protein n=1 Tax=Actinomadura chokoriensis TaxID=454156 RepID=A0ABV4QWC1_9ACTN